MRYSDSLRYLNSFLNLERITFQPGNRLWNLDRMRILLKWFCHPERFFFPVLIAGTKGKGSTGFFLESILEAAGIRTGFYSSPHLEDPRERIRIGTRKISVNLWAAQTETIRRALRRRKLPPAYGDFTYFEILTLLAILSFRAAGIQVGIFEVGMGGRLDATNVLKARVVGLVPVHYDHEAFLGNTLADIAREKAAVIHPEAQVVTSPQFPEALKEIKKRITEQKATLWFAPRHLAYPTGLTGDYQKINGAVALQMARILSRVYGYPVTEQACRKGLAAGHWPGRFELFPGRPEWLLDGAHNPASILALVRNLKKIYVKRKCLLVFGTSRDKKSDQMLKTLSRFFPDMILAPTSNPRSQEISVLMRQARGLFRTVVPAGDVREAMALARKMAGLGTLIVATGSFYLIGEVRKSLG